MIEAEEITITLTTFEHDSLLNSLLTNNSSLSKAQRILCYVIRFIRNCHNKDAIIGNKSPNFTLTELTAALYMFVQYVQETSFSDDITNLKKVNQSPNR